MDWVNCISSERLGKRSQTSSRNEFERDYDRLIFSAAFRRLQNKTQVFPLPGNLFVHNRLTHSLEVASVGRSLGSLVGRHLEAQHPRFDTETRDFYRFQLSSVIAAACLAHDLGNPPFGHSGEKAISSYFMEHADSIYSGKQLRAFYTDDEWADLSDFEGNANAFHILTHKYPGRLQQGLSLTKVTLASILKYPCASTDVNKEFKHRSKYGYFKWDETAFVDVAQSTHMVPDFDAGENPRYKRHPFVYLVEAADDICYRVIDLEDSHRVNILSTEYVGEIFMNVLFDFTASKVEREKVLSIYSNIADANEKIGFLRAKLINVLVNAARDVFIDHAEEILSGNWNNTLFKVLENRSKALVEARKISIEKIYNHASVVQTEIAGYHVIEEMIKMFIPVAIKQDLSPLEKKFAALIPAQYLLENGTTPYEKTLSVLDFIAGMTDGYATELYQKSRGITI